jgi:hypothetical protein
MTDKTLRMKLDCESLDNISFSSEYRPNICPLTLLSWDIEVCT